MAIAAHDHEVSGDIRGMGKDRVRNIDALGRDALDLDIASMAERSCPISIPGNSVVFVRPATTVNTSIISARSSTGIASPMARAAVRLPSQPTIIKFYRNHMRYRKTYRAQSDTWMMISLTDCLQQCLPSSADAAKRFPCQIKVPAILWSKWSHLLWLKGS